MPKVVPVPNPAREAALCTQWRDVVEMRRDETALIDSTTQRTFVEVDTASSNVAAALHGDSTPVAVLGDLGATIVTVMLGVIRSGRALVCLDPALPDDRISTIVASSGAGHLVVAAKHRHRVTSLEQARVLDPESLTELPGSLSAESRRPESNAVVHTVAAGVASAPAVVRHPATLTDPPDIDSLAAASIVYTSGSTGQPKGVVLSHRTVVNGARLSREHFGLSSADRVLLVLPHGFAAGQEVIFMALLNGVTLCMIDPRTSGLREVLRQADIWKPTTIHLTPSLLRSVVGHTHSASTWSHIRLFTTCGEPVHARDLEAARRVFLVADYVNYLGSSETGHLAFHHIAAGESCGSGVVPAGLPAASKQIRILTESGEPAAPGQVGRLEVNSHYLASGYHSSPGSNFRTEPNGTSTFRSGDLARIEANGTLSLLGRADAAIKVRGYLVEPAEIEGALTGLDEVVESVVQAMVDGEGRQRLVAYVAVDPHRRTPAVSALRRHLIELLPAWMVPSDFVIIDELPRNERGKVDRLALPSVETRSQRVRPSTQWEVAVAEIWSRVLGADSVGADETFVGLGGDSLAVEEMLTLVDEELGRELTSLDLANAPSVGEFAELVATSRGPQEASISKLLATFTATGTGTPIFCLAGAGGTALLFHQLAQELGEHHPVHALQMQGYENVALVDWSVQAVAKRYLKVINKLAPTGRIILIGHSLGGLVALEIAHRLRQQGRPDPRLVILDTVLPPSTARDSGDPAPELRIPGMKGQTKLELWKTRFQLLGIGLYPYSGATRDSVFFQQGLRLTDRYRPVRWDGASLIILTAENIDSRSWWSQVVESSRPIIEFECNHVDILKTPYVKRVAATIKGCLLEWGA